MGVSNKECCPNRTDTRKIDPLNKSYWLAYCSAIGAGAGEGFYSTHPASDSHSQTRGSAHYTVDDYIEEKLLCCRTPPELDRLPRPLSTPLRRSQSEGIITSPSSSSNRCEDLSRSSWGSIESPVGEHQQGAAFRLVGSVISEVESLVVATRPASTPRSFTPSFSANYGDGENERCGTFNSSAHLGSIRRHSADSDSLTWAGSDQPRSPRRSLKRNEKMLACTNDCPSSFPRTSSEYRDFSMSLNTRRGANPTRFRSRSQPDFMGVSLEPVECLLYEGSATHGKDRSRKVPTIQKLKTFPLGSADEPGEKTCSRSCLRKSVSAPLKRRVTWSDDASDGKLCEVRFFEKKGTLDEYWPKESEEECEGMATFCRGEISNEIENKELFRQEEVCGRVVEVPLIDADTRQKSKGGMVKRISRAIKRVVYKVAVRMHLKDYHAIAEETHALEVQTT